MAVFRFTAFAVSVAVAAAVAPPVASASLPTAGQALAELNDWRAEAGLEAVATLDPELSEGCRLHNAYMALNGLGHVEHPGLPGYTELGALAGRTSVLGPGHEGPRAQWEEAVYHRMVLLEPRLRTTWFDASSGATCMGVWGITSETSVRSEALTLHPWPPAGASGFPTSFGGGEIPDPRDAVPGDAARLGYLLSVNVNGPWFSTLGSVLTGVSLTPDGGAPVPVSGIDRDNPEGSFLSGGFALFPHEPLAEATWYTARATGYVTGIDVGPSRVDHPFDFSWRFGTRGAGPDTGAATPEPAAAPTDHAPLAIATALAVSGRLRGGRLQATVTVKPAGRRTITLSIQRPERSCSRCRTRWVTVRRLRRAAKTRQTLRIKTSLRTLRLRATAPAAAGLEAATATRTIRR